MTSYHQCPILTDVFISGHPTGHHSGTTETDHVRARDPLQGWFLIGYVFTWLQKQFLYVAFLPHLL